jgi:tetratricopeptide (TPR) repeat protein
MGNLLIMAGQVQAARGSYFSAARFAREGYRMLDAVRQSTPEIPDTYFALGLYLYYVDLSSPLVRSLQRLLFFPPGDSRLGLRYLERAARESRRFGPMAQVALAAIYAADRGRLDLALAHLRTLREAYPENPFVLRFTIEVLTELGDVTRARNLLDEGEALSKREGFAFAAWHRDVFALLRARLDEDDFRLHRAVGALDVLVSGEGNRPGWVRPAAASSLARISLLAGDEKRYRELLRAPWSEGHDGRYRRRMKRLPERLVREGYDRDLHQVFRHWIAGDLDGARERLQRLREIRGDRGRVPYLLGEIHRLQGNVEGAEEAYRAVLAQGAAAPPGAAGWSLVRLGDLHAGRGDREGARRCYLRALQSEGFAEHRVAGYRLDTMAGEGVPAKRQESGQSR